MRKNIMIILTASLGLAAAPGAWAATVLSDNLGKAPFDADPVFGPIWGAARFNTDAQAYSLSSVVLWAKSVSSGSATAELYSDNGGTTPNASLGSLSLSGSFPPSAGPATFTASGITLAPTSAYWIVVKGTGSGVDWYWTDDLTGTGAGFDTHYAISDNAGSTWGDIADVDPFQMQVNVDLAQVPEPGQWAMMAVTALGIAGYAARRVRAKTIVG